MSNSSDDVAKQFMDSSAVLMESYKVKQLAMVTDKARIFELLNNSVVLDSTINFKVNSVFKAEFERICKSQHTTVSRELKHFMHSVIQNQKLSHF